MNDRIKKLQKKVTDKKLSALFVSDPYNVRYLCGFTGTHGTLLITPKKVTLITDARYFMTAKKWGLAYFDRKQKLTKLMGRFKVVGFEDRHLTVAKLKVVRKELGGVRFKPASGLVEAQRIIKDAGEIRIIKKGVRMACESLKRLQKIIRPGMSEDQIEWELLKIIRELGGEGFSFPPIITFGKDTADVHHQKSPNRLKAGQMILIDYGLVYKGYITDTTRTFLPPKSSQFEQKIYSTVLAANRAAIKAVKVGAKFADIDKAARDVIEKAGFGKYFTHACGHGTGLEVHEAPNVSALSKDKVRPGMVFTIEPGIYMEGKGGVRIEDMVYVNEKGKTEVLT